MDPEPMPTRNPSAPASISRRACCPVITLPATISNDGNSFLQNRIISTWYVESPWLESKITQSTPADTSARTRSRSLGRVPTAAPQSKRPRASRLARFGSVTGAPPF